MRRSPKSLAAGLDTAGPASTSTGRPIRTAWIFLAAVALFEIVSTVAFLAAADFSPATLNDPARLLVIGDRGADLMRVACLLDMFGYLSAVPLAHYLRDRFRGEAAIDLFTIAGVLALVAGALGAVIFASAGAPLIREYVTATPTGKQAIATTFATLHRIVFFALWQTLDALLAGVWLAGTGRLAWKKGATGLALVLGALGAIGAVVAIVHISGVYPGS